MKKKLISMICALSMVFSVLGGFSILNVQAADAQVKLDAKVDGSNLIVDVSYEGASGGLSAIDVKLNPPSGVDVEKAVFAFDSTMGSPADLSFNDADINIISVGGMWFTTDAPESGKLGTITIPITGTLAYPVDITIKEATMLNSTSTKYQYNEDGTEYDNPLSAIGTTVEDPDVTPTPTPTATPTASPTPTPVAQPVKVKDIVPSNGVTKIDEAVAAESASTNGEYTSAALEITFQDKSGNDISATYGKDYVITIDGVALDEDVVYNAVNGFDPATLKKIVENGEIVIYNANIASVSSRVYNTALTNGGNTAQGIEGTSTETKTEEVTPITTVTPTPTATAEPEDDSWSSWGKSLSVGSTITLNAVYTDQYGDKHSGDEIEYDITSGSSYATLNGRKLKGKKAGTVKVEATYYDDDGDAHTNTKSFKVTSSSSSGGSTGTGTIASGNLGGTTTGTTSDVNFTDIWNVEWAQTAINALAKAGIINGRSATIFDPEANVTRAEFAKMLVGAFGLTGTEGATSSFTDVPTTHWAYSYVSIASRLGVILGYDAYTFGPEDNITRQDMAVMCYRMMTARSTAISDANAPVTFTDEDQIADYAKTAVATLQKAGIINGMGDGTFAPTGTATRAQAAVIIYNIIK